MDEVTAKTIGEGMVSFFETNVAPADLVTDDIFFDLNVPQWRYQVQGIEAAAKVFADSQPRGAKMLSWEARPSGDDRVFLTTEREIPRDDGVHYCRTLNELKVVDGLVAEWTMYCTGVWSPDQRDRQAREAPMLRT